MSNQKLSWGILGTGRIAAKFAQAVTESQTGQLVAVGSRQLESAERFGWQYDIPRKHADYQSLLDDATVEAVYISTPNHLHAPWAIRAAEAKKHILCEKPLALNQHEAEAIIDAARTHGVFLMEAFMYRCHPQMLELERLIRTGAIGNVRHIQAIFSYDDGGDTYHDVRYNNAFGGGAIMDVGCYCTSIVARLAGAAAGTETIEPSDLKGTAVIGSESQVDHWASAVARFDGPLTATMMCGMQVDTDWTLRVQGTRGSIQVPQPWFPGEQQARITLWRAGEPEPEHIDLNAGRGLYTLEADLVAEHVRRGRHECSAMSWHDTLVNMRMLDQWRASAGITFQPETVSGIGQMTAAGRPLQSRADHPMTYGSIPGVSLPVSRLILGAMYYVCGNVPQTCSVLDHFVECGGNCLDTGYVYGTEAIVGNWLRARGIRDQLVIIGKGAHPPNCYPAAVSKELDTSLQRMGIDHIDLYLLHRDNPEVPVGEFMDALYDELRRGRIKAYGVSNWTTERIAAAQRYAADHGRPPLAASSVNVSLATWNEPWWEGCTSASDASTRQWYQQAGLPLLAWSSQASGFFAGDIRPEKAHTEWDRDMIRVWWNADNERRRDRARVLAKEKGVTPIQIALAYVLNQPQNIFALIGPRRIAETQESLAALAVRLSPDESAWLFEDKN